MRLFGCLSISTGLPKIEKISECYGWSRAEDELGIRCRSVSGVDVVVLIVGDVSTCSIEWESIFDTRALLECLQDHCSPTIGWQVTSWYCSGEVCQSPTSLYSPVHRLHSMWANDSLVSMLSPVVLELLRGTHFDLRSQREHQPAHCHRQEVDSVLRRVFHGYPCTSLLWASIAADAERCQALFAAIDYVRDAGNLGTSVRWYSRSRERIATDCSLWKRVRMESRDDHNTWLTHRICLESDRYTVCPLARIVSRLERKVDIVSCSLARFVCAEENDESAERWALPRGHSDDSTRMLSPRNQWTVHFEKPPANARTVLVEILNEGHL